MSLVKWENKEGVAVLEMCSGDNQQNLAFAEAMSNALDEILADETVNSVILTSTNEKIFSTGVDVNWVMTQMAESKPQNVKDFMNTMNVVFRKILTYPVPVIAAINGHAFGNGAILSCSCDFRFMRSDRGYFCFPEVDLGILFAPGMLAFVKKAIPLYKFNEMYLSGRRVGAPELEEHHVIEKSCANVEELMKDAMAFAKTFTKKRTILEPHKCRINKPITDIMDNEDPQVIEALDLFIA